MAVPARPGRETDHVSAPFGLRERAAGVQAAARMQPGSAARRMPCVEIRLGTRSPVLLPGTVNPQTKLVRPCRAASARVTGRAAASNTRFIPRFHHQIARDALRKRITGVHAKQFEPGQIMSAFGVADRTGGRDRPRQAQSVIVPTLAPPQT
ncbi:MAG: hypothetical protein ACLFTP_09060 [Rhodosalinus sp.]